MSTHADITVEEAFLYARRIAPYDDPESVNGLSNNEKRIVVLANEVARLRKLVPASKRVQL